MEKVERFGLMLRCKCKMIGTQTSKVDGQVRNTLGVSWCHLVEGKVSRVTAGPGAFSVWSVHVPSSSRRVTCDHVNTWIYAQSQEFWYTFKHQHKLKAIHLHVMEQFHPGGSVWGRSPQQTIIAKGQLKSAIKAAFIIVWAEIYLFIATHAEWEEINTPCQSSALQTRSLCRLSPFSLRPQRAFNCSSLWMNQRESSLTLSAPAKLPALHRSHQQGEVHLQLLQAAGWCCDVKTDRTCSQFASWPEETPSL